MSTTLRRAATRAAAAFVVRSGRRTPTAIESAATARLRPVDGPSRFGTPSSPDAWLAHRDGCRCNQAGCA